MIPRWILILLGVFVVSCSSSTKTREVPGLVLDAMQVATGRNSQMNTDFKYQITVKGRYILNTDCLIIRDNLGIEITGPFPDPKILATSAVTEDNSYEIVTMAKPATYLVSLINTRTNKTIDSRQIRAGDTDRFDVDFSSCGAF